MPKRTRPDREPFGKELNHLSRLLRQTRRQVDAGQLDVTTASINTARLAHAIARLRLARHTLTPRPDDAVDQLQEEAKRILRLMGFGEND